MEIIPGYSNLEKISEGYGSLLFRGTREKDHRRFLTRMYGTENTPRANIARLKKEFSAIKDLKCNGLLKAHEIEFFPDHLVIISEDFEGIDLKTYYEAGSNGVERFLHIALQLAETLAELHHASIIHKDLKPKNILVHEETGTVKIIDYGFSSIITREYDAVYDPWVLTYTLPYFSPEQTGRMNRTMDHRTDLYSLGVVFYEILTGMPPFFSKNPLELFHSQTAKKPAPPRHKKPEIPESISHVVMKLLSKDPEERYHCGCGLKADLEVCLDQMKRTGEIYPFILGGNDRPHKLIIPQKIYGREKEIHELMKAFERVSKGTTELALITGVAGMGKTAIINEIHKPVVEHKGYFVSGKFEELLKEKPYVAIFQAFTGLIRQILHESDERLQQWRDILKKALGNNVRIITDIIPLLEHLIGEQPEIQELGPEESKNRFNLVIQSFVRVFARKEHPLVVFLDDLQWADSASLNLLQALLNDPDTKYILFLGAFRDNEVTDCHPLRFWIDEIKKSSMAVRQIPLQPLHVMDVNQLIVDAFESDPNSVTGLADLVHQKTSGNPFFVKQLIKTLYDNEMFTFSIKTGWQWDVDLINQVHISENVVELMTARILNLQKDSQEVLKLGSSLGNKFDLETLAEVYNKTIEEMYGDLYESINNGLVQSTRRGYAFVHDRIREAAYSLIPDKEKKTIHLRIGSFLLEHTRQDEISEKVFDIVDHLNNGLDDIVEQKKRIELSHLNLMAGKKAKSAAAYAAAVNYLEHAATLLPESSWEAFYDLTFSVYRENAECRYLVGDFKRAEKLFDKVLENAQTDLEKAKIHALKIVLKSNQSDYAGAIDQGIRGLQLLGLHIPEFPDQTTIHQEMTKIQSRLGDGKVEDLVNLPELKEPNKQTAMDILNKLIPPSYFFNPNFLMLTVLKAVNISLKHGMSIYSSLALVTYGGALCARFSDYKTGHKFGKLGIAVNEKFKNLELKARVYHLFGVMVSHWRESTDVSVSYLLEAFHSSRESGDLLYRTYPLCAIFQHMIRKGEYLDSIIARYKQYWDITKTTQYEGMKINIESFYRMVLALKGPTRKRSTHFDDPPDEGKFMARMRALPQSRYLYKYVKVQTLYILTDYREAVKYGLEVYKDIDNILFGLIYVAEFSFYFSLSLAAHFEEVNGKSKKEYMDILTKNVKKFQIWAENCPENFLHQYLLVKAELSRLEENDIAAMKLYARAIEKAKESGYINHEALGNELAAKFFLFHENQTAAKAHINEAYACYEKWGAGAKLACLEETYPHLLRDVVLEKPSVSNDGLYPLKTMDYATVVDSLQAVSSEIEMERLLEKLMSITVSNAGATRGLFISSKDNNLSIEAERITGEGEVSTIKSFPLEWRSDLLKPSVYHVKRHMEDLVLDDASNEDDFACDPYVLEKRLKSVSCVPVVRKSRLAGILYLENNIVTGAFTRERLEVIRLLASQAAISIENARMVDEMKKTQGALKKSEERYSGLLKRLNEAVYRMSLPEGKYEYMSPAAEVVFGYASKDFLDNPMLVQKIIHPESADYFKREWEKLLQGEVSPKYEYKIKDPQGNDRWITQTNTGIFDENGRIVAIEGCCSDITQRKKAKLLLEESEKKYRNLIEHVNDGIAIVRGKSLRYVNLRFAEILGYTVDEMINKSVEEYMHPDELPKLSDIYECRMAGKQTPAVYDAILKDKAGKNVYVEANAGITTYDEKPSTLISIRDITDRKQAEEELQKSEERYRKLFNLSLAGIFLTLPKGEILAVNDMGARLLGYDTTEDLIGTNIIQCYKHPQERPKIYPEIAGGDTYQYELDLIKKDGSHTTGLISSSLVEISGRRAILSSGMDITERKLSERERERLNTELLEKNKELEQVLYVTSHDLRSPLVNIQGFSKELESSVNAIASIVFNKDLPSEMRKRLNAILREEIPESLQFITGGVAKMDALLLGLLHMSRLGRATLTIKRLNVKNIISDILRASEFQINKADVEIRVGKLPQCRGDEVQINQVFTNILDNALKYMASERKGVITVSGEKKYGTVVYCIEDNGIGIDEAHHEKIFEIFYRLDPRKCEGEGMGLNIVQKILARHNGQIWVESRLGAGSRFYVSLPAA